LDPTFIDSGRAASARMRVKGYRRFSVFFVKNVVPPDPSSGVPNAFPSCLFFPPPPNLPCVWLSGRRELSPRLSCFTGVHCLSRRRWGSFSPKVIPGLAREALLFSCFLGGVSAEIGGGLGGVGGFAMHQ